MRRNATVLYRGPEFAQYARQLTLSAQLYAYSGRSAPAAAQLLKHCAKMIDVVTMLMSRRRAAQQLPTADPSYGLIRGDDERCCWSCFSCRCRCRCCCC